MHLPNPSLLRISAGVSMLITFHSNECVGRKNVCVLTSVSPLHAAVYTSHNLTEFSFSVTSFFFFKLFTQLLKIAVMQIMAPSMVHATRSNFTILDGCSTH